MSPDDVSNEEVGARLCRMFKELEGTLGAVEEFDSQNKPNEVSIHHCCALSTCIVLICCFPTCFFLCRQIHSCFICLLLPPVRMTQRTQCQCIHCNCLGIPKKRKRRRGRMKRPIPLIALIVTMRVTLYCSRAPRSKTSHLLSR